MAWSRCTVAIETTAHTKQISMDCYLQFGSRSFNCTVTSVVRNLVGWAEKMLNTNIAEQRIKPFQT